MQGAIYLAQLRGCNLEPQPVDMVRLPAPHRSWRGRRAVAVLS
jgi:hypothetical protein